MNRPVAVPESSRLAVFSLAVRDSSMKRFRTVDFASANWRPSPNSLSVAELARHLVDADRWLADTLHGFERVRAEAVAGSFAVASEAEWERLLAQLESAGRERSTLISRLRSADLDRKMKDTRFGGEVTTWWVIVRGNLDHEIHHRGQLAAYLRILADASA